MRHGSLCLSVATCFVLLLQTWHEKYLKTCCSQALILISSSALESSKWQMIVIVLYIITKLCCYRICIKCVASKVSMIYHCTWIFAKSLRIAVFKQQCGSSDPIGLIKQTGMDSCIMATYRTARDRWCEPLLSWLRQLGGWPDQFTMQCRRPIGWLLIRQLCCQRLCQRGHHLVDCAVRTGHKAIELLCRHTASRHCAVYFRRLRFDMIAYYIVMHFT